MNPSSTGSILRSSARRGKFSIADRRKPTRKGREIARQGQRLVQALAVRGPYKGTSGHDHHVREFVRELARRGLRLQLTDIPEWAPAKLPDDRRDAWFDTLHATVDASVVLHFCMPHQVRPVPGRLN